MHPYAGTWDELLERLEARWGRTVQHPSWWDHELARGDGATVETVSTPMEETHADD